MEALLILWFETVLEARKYFHKMGFVLKYLYGSWRALDVSCETFVFVRSSFRIALGDPSVSHIRESKVSILALILVCMLGFEYLVHDGLLK